MTTPLLTPVPGPPTKWWPAPAADPQDLAVGITQERADLLLGFSESDAARCAAELGWAFRVGVRDGESFALTMDYSMQRVTVEVKDDWVTAITVG